MNPLAFWAITEGFIILAIIIIFYRTYRTDKPKRYIFQTWQNYISNLRWRASQHIYINTTYNPPWRRNNTRRRNNTSGKIII